MRERTRADAVLVSVESVNNLGRAYPNYFADTRVFLQLMQQALSGHSRGIKNPAEIPLQPELFDAPANGSKSKVAQQLAK